MAKVLALETSCDESAAAVVEHSDGRLRVLSHRIASQIEEHAQWGGVVPEIASRRHVEALPHLIEQSLNDAGLSISDLDADAGTVTGTEIVSLTPGPMTDVSVRPVASSQPRTLEIAIVNLSFN